LTLQAFNMYYADATVFSSLLTLVKAPGKPILYSHPPQWTVVS
jgi:hypothetical protein